MAKNGTVLSPALHWRTKMTDGLVKMLQSPELYTEISWQELMSLSADRIEELELIVWQLEVELDDATEELMGLRGKQ